jgi:hypothetical protein
MISECQRDETFTALRALKRHCCPSFLREFAAMLWRSSPSSGYQQTVEGRKQRLNEALVERLKKGWSHLGRNMFGPVCKLTVRVHAV